MHKTKIVHILSLHVTNETKRSNGKYQNLGRHYPLNEIKNNFNSAKIKNTTLMHRKARFYKFALNIKCGLDDYDNNGGGFSTLKIPLKILMPSKAAEF